MRDITNGQLSPKKQDTWKRRARYQMVKRFDSNKMSNDPPKKIHLKREVEQGVGKKKQDKLLNHLKVKKPGQEKVGENQPRRSL